MWSLVLASSLSGCVFHVWEQELNPEPWVVPQNRNGGAQVHRYTEQAANLPREMGGLILSATGLNLLSGEN